MTEYEIADLAVSGSFRIQGQVALFQTQVSSVGEGIQQFMTILFSYMAAAYFVGMNLSRKQAWIFTVIYVMWQLWAIVAVISRGFALQQIVEVLRRLLDSQGEISAAASILAEIPILLRMSSISLLLAALIASLYFMWSIRHPKAS
jgi:hypothetical protein